jgi:hypothetical protein
VTRVWQVGDAFSCKGGGGLGYIQRNAEVTGCDKNDYAAEYPGKFVQGDAVEFIRDHGRDFDFIHISAPCQPRTRGNAAHRNEFGIARNWEGSADLIARSRAAAIETGVPYVIENVVDAAPDLINPILLCGRMFGLSAVDDDGTPLILDRHRLFEFGNMPQPTAPAHPKHKRTTGIGFVPDPASLELGIGVEEQIKLGMGVKYLTGDPHIAGVYGGARRDKWEAKYVRHGGYVPPNLQVLRDLLETPHISTEHELFEAIPPAYTRWVFDQFLSLAA